VAIKVLGGHEVLQRERRIGPNFRALVTIMAAGSLPIEGRYPTAIRWQFFNTLVPAR
jgi:hypothetical protein